MGLLGIKSKLFVRSVTAFTTEPSLQPPRWKFEIWWCNKYLLLDAQPSLLILGWLILLRPVSTGHPAKQGPVTYTVICFIQLWVLIFCGFQYIFNLFFFLFWKSKCVNFWVIKVKGDNFKKNQQWLQKCKAFIFKKKLPRCRGTYL